jgi:hypothetical protein
MTRRSRDRNRQASSESRQRPAARSDSAGRLSTLHPSKVSGDFGSTGHRMRARCASVRSGLIESGVLPPGVRPAGAGCRFFWSAVMRRGAKTPAASGIARAPSHRFRTAAERPRRRGHPIPRRLRRRFKAAIRREGNILAPAVLPCASSPHSKIWTLVRGPRSTSVLRGREFVRVFPGFLCVPISSCNS